MADSMQNISAIKTAFFAVGCGHLLGTKGLINLLKAKGLQLTPVYSGNRMSITLMKKLFETGMKNVRKELEKEKEKTSADNDDKLEGIKEDIVISTLKPAIKKSTAKKTPLKKLKTPIKKQ
jgi:hypothetical protein